MPPPVASWTIAYRAGTAAIACTRPVTLPRVTRPGALIAITATATRDSARTASPYVSAAPNVAAPAAADAKRAAATTITRAGQLGDRTSTRIDNPITAAAMPAVAVAPPRSSMSARPTSRTLSPISDSR